MEARANEAFQEFLLARLEGNDKTIRESLPNVIPEVRIELNRKFVALKLIEKIFSNLPQLLSSPRELLLKEEEPIKNRKFAGCEIIRKIGHGGMGVVYLAKQEKLGREVVVKVLRPFASDSESLKQRFQRESRIIGHLDHDNIVPVYDIGEEDGSCYIIMKYVEGIPLSQILEKMARLDKSNIELKDLSKILRECLGKPPSEKIQLAGKNLTEFFCALMSKIAYAVQYVHEHGVVHRDIKPSNIILKSDGTPVLVDFGLGQDEIEQSLTLSGEFLGTPIYAAPESFQKKTTHNNYQLDVYSLGVTLYELLTGGLPYEGDNLYEIIANIKNKDPLPPKHYWRGIPRDLETIIVKAIAKDTQYRYQSVKDFIEDLQSFLDCRPIKAKAPSYIYRTSQWLRRNRKPAWAVGALLICAAFAVGWHYYSLFRDHKRISAEVAQLIQMGKLEEAAKKLEPMTSLFPKKSESWLALGALQTISGNLDEGIHNLEHSLQIKDNPTARAALSAAYLLRGDIEGAEAEAEKVLKYEPENYSALKMRGQIEVLKGNYPEAILILKKQGLIESKVTLDDLNQSMAFANPAIGQLAILFNERGFSNIAEKYVRESISTMPFNRALYHLMELLPLTKRRPSQLQSVKTELGSGTFTSVQNDLELAIPFGWSRQPMLFAQMYSEDILAYYQSIPLGLKDFLIPPALLVAEIKASGDIRERTNFFIDGIIRHFNGSTSARAVQSDKISPYQRYFLQTDIALQMGISLRVKTLVVENDGRIYLTVC